MKQKAKAVRYWYTYRCAPSSETRGRRPGHDLGCGATLVRSTKREIIGRERPQGSPCIKCKKRTRLHEGLVKEWFDPQDALLYASEENRLNDIDMPRNRGEQSGE